jgi:ABC-2 type transport system ATP-binding protein
MSTVITRNISKRFGQTQAVKDVSLEIRPGEIFGLLGPNGAGKTTIIRMILDIIRPDTGTVQVFGSAMSEEKKNKIGYLPEERGLYADVKLWKVILYLASLKGMEGDAAKERAEKLLKRLDLWQHRDKKLSELSRGMHQKAQFIVTILHDPALLIVDEPFSGLDPVNTELVKRMLIELRDSGKTIVMSTHQMHQVEAMCDRISLINRGEVVIEGEVEEVRRRFGGNTVEVRGTGPIDTLTEVSSSTHSNGAYHIMLEADTTPQVFLKDLVAHPEIEIEQFSVVLPALNEIFIQVVGGSSA